MSNEPESPREREHRLRLREAADTIFAAKFAGKYKNENELIARAKFTMDKIFSTVMEVVNADAERGGAYDPNAASRLIEKMLVDSLNLWDKDELLFLCALIHTAVLLEKVQDVVSSGMIGKNKDYPV